MYNRDEMEAYLNARPSDNASPLAAMIRQLLEREEWLRAYLESIAHMGHDCPATFEGDEAAWKAHRAYLMQSLAREALK